VEDPDLRDSGHVGIQCTDDLHQAFNICSGIGYDQRITLFICGEGCVLGDEGLQIFPELGHVDIAYGYYMCDHFV